jgi:Protein of unknown function (DUF3048) N-terminal domain/Protein of unknown function (DUF3048) C-terminal domain
MAGRQRRAPGRHRHAGWVAALTGIALALGGCSGDDTPAAQPTPSAAPTTPTPTPPPTRPKAKPKPRPPAVNPLTGRGRVPRGPVIAVKIDDTAAGRPPIGLEAANVVYVEQVEAGATRLVAVYASRHPDRVGPVRSVRTSDPRLLAPYAGPALAYSGGAGGPLRALHRSRVVDGGVGAHPGAYSRSGARPAPYNLIVNLAGLAGHLPRRTARARDVGFRWGVEDPHLATSRNARRVTATVGRTRITFRWDWESHRWLRLLPSGGVSRTRSGVRIGTPNLIIQFCRTRRDGGNVDVNGSPSIYTETVGRGTALVFRDGRMLVARWSRLSNRSPTRFVDRAGRDLLLRPGGAWLLLASRGSRTTVR